jgi:hypothetical protein
MDRLGFAVSRVPKCEGPGAPTFSGTIHFLGTWATRPVGEDFHWTQAREVLVKMEERSHFGKLVLTVG